MNQRGFYLTIGGLAVLGLVAVGLTLWWFVWSDSNDGVTEEGAQYKRNILALKGSLEQDLRMLGLVMRSGDVSDPYFAGSVKAETKLVRDDADDLIALEPPAGWEEFDENAESAGKLYKLAMDDLEDGVRDVDASQIAISSATIDTARAILQLVAESKNPRELKKALESAAAH